jgi:DNA-binding response OmpR family regulator
MRALEAWPGHNVPNNATPSTMKDILIIDDDRFITDSVGRFLTSHGYEIRRCHTAGDGFRAISEDQPDLLVLDLGLPDQDGISLCRRVRSQWSFPILMLTSRGESMDKVVGLEVGADDYLTKPFDANELLARIRALLRRVTEYRLPRDLIEEETRVGPLVVNHTARKVTLQGMPLEATETEFKILAYLAVNAGRAISREMLFETVWGYDIEFSSNSLEVLIYRLRQKLEVLGEKGLIKTLRGYGYKLEA